MERTQHCQKGQSLCHNLYAGRPSGCAKAGKENPPKSHTHTHTYVIMLRPAIVYGIHYPFEIRRGPDHAFLSTPMNAPCPVKRIIKNSAQLQVKPRKVSRCNKSKAVQTTEAGTCVLIARPFRQKERAPQEPLAWLTSAVRAMHIQRAREPPSLPATPGQL